MSIEAPSALAEARSRAYELFSALSLNGVTEDIIDLLDAVPGLAQAAAHANAETHFDVMSFDVFPFQSVFLDESAMPGGKETDRVMTTFRSIGFVPPPTGPSPDHIGLLLDAMAFLCGAEADALHDRRHEIVQRIHVMQQNLLAEHLLRWWPALAESLAYKNEPFYRSWSEAITELVHHQEHTLFAASNTPSASEPLDDAPTPELASSACGLADIAAALMRPHAVGAFVGRSTLRTLGRSDRIAGGFGPRKTVLTNLFRSAARHDVFDALLVKLQSRFKVAAMFYANFSRDAPTLSARWANKWQQTSLHTVAALESIRNDAALKASLSDGS